jgi:inosose dehydratase
MSLLTGTQLYGWGQVYSMGGEQISDHYDEVLSSISDMGLDTAEGSLNAQEPGSVREWAALLRQHDLRPASLYSGGGFHSEEPAEATIDQLAAAGRVMAEEGFSVLDLNPDPIGREKTDEELTIQARSLEDLGAQLKDMGIALGLHNHTPEMVNGGREFHHNLRQTDPDLVGLCMDVHWCHRGGGDAAAIFEEYERRIVGLHLRQSIDGVWAEDFCDGDLDYRPIIDALVAQEFEGPVLIELAIEEGTPQTRGPEENHRRSAEHLRSLMT